MPEQEQKIGLEFGMGWLPDYPDYRDYTVQQDEVAPTPKRLGQKQSVKAMLTKMKVVDPTKVSIPPSIDLRRWCSPIENQDSLGSCTAQAGVGLVEYYETRASGRHTDASRLFLYKATRNLLRWTGDRGAFLRTTMAGMVLFGVPPEEYWPYVVADFDKEPSSFCYAFAQNYQALQYFRLDPLGTSEDFLWKRIKALLAAGLPSMFGFTVFSSIRQAANDGKIPFPCRGERILGGHAVVAVGYDDEAKIRNAGCGIETTGALLIRNSWGEDWGDKGYGWLPYDYVLRGLAIDWWCLLRSEWVDTEKFGLSKRED
jgi:C1A family cysteine protease